MTASVRALDPNLPLIGVKTMDASIGDAMWRTRVAAWLLSAFAGLAVLLTGIGVFGVMAQIVVQRTAEFGVRMALGARPQDVLALVLRRAILVTGVGLALGLAGAFAATLAPAIRASRKKRSIAFALDVSDSRRILSATWNPSSLSWHLYTIPIPPEPTFATYR